MDFLKEFSKQFSSKARTASEKTREVAEAARLSDRLRQEEAALDALYARYGRASYAARDGRGSADALKELALRIQAKTLEVEELTAARDAALAMKRCMNCGAIFSREARFCSACGKKLPEEAPRPEPVEMGEYCPACGAKREDDGPRCPVCGLDFTPPPAAEAPPREEAGPDPDPVNVEEPEDTME